MVLVEHREDFPDPVAVLDRVPHWPVRPDSVEVSPAIADPVEVAGGDEVADDALGGPLSDPDPFGHVTQADAWIAGNADQGVRVVGQERPLRHTGTVLR